MSLPGEHGDHCPALWGSLCTCGAEITEPGSVEMRLALVALAHCSLYSPEVSAIEQRKLAEKFREEMAWHALGPRGRHVSERGWQKNSTPAEQCFNARKG